MSRPSCKAGRRTARLCTTAPSSNRPRRRPRSRRRIHTTSTRRRRTSRRGSMTLPLVVLAGLSIVGGLINLPFANEEFNFLTRWLEPVFGVPEPEVSSFGIGFALVDGRARRRDRRHRVGSRGLPQRAARTPVRIPWSSGSGRSPRCSRTRTTSTSGSPRFVSGPLTAVGPLPQRRRRPQGHRRRGERRRRRVQGGRRRLAQAADRSRPQLRARRSCSARWCSSATCSIRSVA